MNKPAKKGFTLIELLVVISIISLLATLAVTALNNARVKSRDARRKADIKQISTALDLNYDKHGAYTQPERCCTDTSVGCGGCGCAVTNYPNGTDWDTNCDLRDLITDGFMGKLPKDPLNNSSYFYSYEPEDQNQTLSLCARLEAGGTFCINRP